MQLLPQRGAAPHTAARSKPSHFHQPDPEPQQLSTQLIDAGMIETRPEALNVAEIAREAASDIDASVIVDIAGALRVHADPDHVLRILRNLLGNAKKHGRSPVTVSAARGAALIVLRVDDCGPQVPESFRVRQFEKFARGPGARDEEGSGAGSASRSWQSARPYPLARERTVELRLRHPEPGTYRPDRSSASAGGRGTGDRRIFGGSSGQTGRVGGSRSSPSAIRLQTSSTGRSLLSMLRSSGLIGVVRSQAASIRRRVRTSLTLLVGTRDSAVTRTSDNEPTQDLEVSYSA